MSHGFCRYTRNSIHTHNENSTLTWPIFTELPNAQQNYVQISYTVFFFTQIGQWTGVSRIHRPSLFYLLTVGVEVVYFHLITMRHTPQSVGLLWTRDRPVAEISTWQHKHSQQTNIHAPGGIRTHDPSKRSAADLRLRKCGHWDRRNGESTDINSRL
jgi:hypothetical protein